MRKAKLITALSLAVLMLVSLSNTVSAEAVVGPPIGGNEVEFDPPDPSPGDSVDVLITWEITDPDCLPYLGSFNLHLKLKDSAGDEVWAEHVSGWAGSPYPTQLEVPSEGTYFLGVQIVATECGREVGNSGNFHPFLVASEGGDFTSVPEFSTIAIPVAAILGLLFFFNHRKRKKS